MCQLAIEDVDGLGVCDIELERGGLSYTVDTLTAIHANDPDAALTFIVGSDTAQHAPELLAREPRRLLELAWRGSRRRACDGAAALERVRDTLEGASVRFLEMPAVAVSSSLVRERVARGEAIEELVGAAVAHYIEKNGLYRARAGAVA